MAIFSSFYIYFNIWNMFIGLKDRTFCFHCGGDFKDWKRTDNPWEKHAAWFPFRVYVRYIKGPNIVYDCEILRLTNYKRVNKMM